MFGRRIRTLQGPDSDVFRDTLLARSGQKVRIYPLKPAKAVRKVSRKWPESGHYAAFLSIIDAENVFSAHLLSGKVDSGGPTHWFRKRKEQFFSSFMTKRDVAESLIKPT